MSDAAEGHEWGVTQTGDAREGVKYLTFAFHKGLGLMLHVFTVTAHQIKSSYLAHIQYMVGKKNKYTVASHAKLWSCRNTETVLSSFHHM